LGAHSLVGSADEFTAMEGQKYAVKFSPSGKEFQNCI